jgi:hypothetical protein
LGRSAFGNVPRQLVSFDGYLPGSELIASAWLGVNSSQAAGWGFGVDRVRVESKVVDAANYYVSYHVCMIYASSRKRLQSIRDTTLSLYPPASQRSYIARYPRQSEMRPTERDGSVLDGTSVVEIKTDDVEPALRDQYFDDDHHLRSRVQHRVVGIGPASRSGG